MFVCVYVVCICRVCVCILYCVLTDFGEGITETLNKKYEREVRDWYTVQGLQGGDTGLLPCKRL